MHSCLYDGDIMHLRLSPKRHGFTYRFIGWYIDLDELAELDGRLLGFGHNRPGLFSFYDHDFGPGDQDDLKSYICRLVDNEGLGAVARVCLLCQPRCLGYIFNSISVYFCYDADDQLLATLYEVTNTFGERHIYLIGADAQRPLNQEAHKQLYVSPFMSMNCRYRFRLEPPARSFSLLILQDEDDNRLFQARWQGQRQPLSSMTLLKTVFTQPMGLKTIFTIHWEALRLWLKRTPLVSHTKSSSFSVSRGLGQWQEEH